ncbi:MAG: hypothetical protein HRT38_15965 [Alteromonadaceae bacterium]|nr:hypothetical protein [Alteromonadaceae bacterium]
MIFNFSKVRSPWHLMTSGQSYYQISRLIKASTEIDNQLKRYVSRSQLSLAPGAEYSLYTVTSQLNINRSS